MKNSLSLAVARQYVELLLNFSPKRNKADNGKKKQQEIKTFARLWAYTLVLTVSV